MPYIGWQRKRLGQGGDRGLGLLKLQLRMRRGFVIFPGAGSPYAEGCISSWAGKMFARTWEKLASTRERLARAGERLAHAGKVSARGKNFRRMREKL